MRLWALGAALCLVCSVAYAETWVGHQVFHTGTASCAGAQTVDYTYTLVGSSFTVANRNGKLTTITIPDSGEVSHDFKSSTGARLRVSGNAKTKDLAITNTDFGCTWKTPPKK